MSIPSIVFSPFTNYFEALDHASQRFGIEPHYWDIWGNEHATLPEVQRAILESLGVNAGSLEELNEALEDQLWKEWNRLSPPVLVVSAGEAEPRLAFRIPSHLEHRTLKVELRWESGWQGAAEHEIASLPALATAELRGQWFVEKEFPLTVSPLGYHELRLSVDSTDEPRVESRTRLIVAPDRAYLPPALENGGRRAGLYISLYGIRSGRSWGCGDFSDLDRLTSWVRRQVGGSFIVLNPLHAIHNRQPFNTSPYLPNCIFYQNHIYLDIDRIDDVRRSSWAMRLRHSDPVRNEIQALNETEFVEYERVARLKRGFLRLGFRRFLQDYRADTPHAREFREFAREEGALLHRYAVYCALDEWLHRRDRNVWIWPDWPAEYQDPDSEAVKDFAHRHWRSVMFHKYVQWQIDRQLAETQEAARREGLSIGLFHDLALATDRCGADLWAHRDFFVAGCRVGAPPDDFSPRGQDWSFPPPASDRHWEDAYQLFRASIQRSCRHGGALRIDHVMRFFRLFWIPAGKEAAEGAYVRDRYEDLVRILALESVRNKVVVIGEDLGTVEPDVRKTLAWYGILSYRLFYFEKRADGELRAPSEYPVQALVSSTTHDLPTLAGFWQARDIEARREAGVLPDGEPYRNALAQRRVEKQKILDSLFRLDLLPDYVPRSADKLPELTGELHNAITGYMASTPSMLFALNQEDLTKENEQQNLPGTTAQYPNWRRKMRYTLEELESSRTVRDFAQMFRNWLGKTGRLES